MTAPLVSFCIPTFNRARYLDSLLSTLGEHLQDFPFSYEVFVGDNASEDETSAVVAKYADWPALRVVRHEENLGGAVNWQYLLTHARGRYFVYVADDDCLLAPEVANVIQMMERQPSVGVVYAPWKLFDLVSDQDLGQFYHLKEDVLVRQGDFGQLLDILLTHRVFPEIAIYRRDVLLDVMPRVHEQAFYAFVHAAEFVQHGDVAFLKDPFYVSITNYFVDHQRQQAGNGEAEYAWDRYRAGLEHVLGRAIQQITPQQRVEFTLRIQDMITERMSVAVRMRVGNQRDAIETYYLAYRLRALGGEHLLPVDLGTLATTAALQFLTRDQELNRGITQLVCLGEYPQALRALIDAKAAVPVHYTNEVTCLQGLDESILVLLRTGHEKAALPSDCRARLVFERNLMSKFAG
jgi:glycosyltransferase involved in cell wall biosynthesis